MAAVIENGLSRSGIKFCWNEPSSRGRCDRGALRTVHDRRRLSGQCNGNQSGKNDQKRKKHFRNGGNERGTPRGSHGVRSHGALHNEKIRAPISEREHESKTHGQAEPLDAQTIGVRAAHADPRMHVGRAERSLQARPATNILQAEPDERNETGNDKKKLKNFVVDGARQSTEVDVGEHDQRRHDNASVKDPRLRESESTEWRVKNVQCLNQLGHGVHGNAGRKNRHGGERNGVQTARFFVETQPQVFRHGAGTGTVVERHHENTDEHHRRDGADPIKVAGEDAVLRAGRAHADNFLRAEVGGNKSKATDPCGYGTASQEKIRAGFHVAFEGRADAQHEREVHGHDDPVDGGQAHSCDLLNCKSLKRRCVKRAT